MMPKVHTQQLMPYAVGRAGLKFSPCTSLVCWHHFTDISHATSYSVTSYVLNK